MTLSPAARAATAAVLLAQKKSLHSYLVRRRTALLAKLDGLDERQMRWPLTPTGTNLLGLVKHVAFVQAGYFGEVFDRPADIRQLALIGDANDGEDMYASADESVEDIVAFHHASAAHADATITALNLDDEGAVPWWPAERRVVTLHQILVHMQSEVAQHLGHADIVREMIDGAAGNNDGNLAEMTASQWSDYRAELVRVAESKPGTTPTL
jgi:hypothetical protein